jgi:membrane protein DedA with SNARE-associated domain
MLKHLLDWYMSQLDSAGYPLIALLMAVESTFLPIPSEMIIPPAAMLAHNSGRFSMGGIILAGALGSWLGATIMYWTCRWAGRPLILKYGRYFLVSTEKFHAAERWASRFGAFGVFLSRLLPVVRHLIGIPAGVVRLDYRIYSIFTLLGSALWTGVLCWVGVAAGRDQKLMNGELRHATLWLAGGLIVLGTLYFALVHPFMRRAAPAPEKP